MKIKKIINKKMVSKIKFNHKYFFEKIRIIDDLCNRPEKEYSLMCVVRPVLESIVRDARQIEIQKMADLKNLVDVQGRKGNWNMDGYMCGLFNGLELALSVFEERNPKYRGLKESDKTSLAAIAAAEINMLTARDK